MISFTFHRNVGCDEEKNIPSTSVGKPVTDDDGESSKLEILDDSTEMCGGSGNAGNLKNISKISINDEKNDEKIVENTSSSSQMQNVKELMT